MHIRKATKEDANSIAALVRRSITELCTEDHKNNPAILALWAGGKTGERLSHWIEKPESLFFVAEDAPGIIGVGALDKEKGSINLNYVSPDFRFKGTSKALVHTMEKALAGHGCKSVALLSTTTARSFYLALGYKEGAPEKGIFGLTVHPMKKDLSDKPSPHPNRPAT